MRSRETLQYWPCCTNVDRHAPAGHMSFGFERGRERLKGLAFVLNFLTSEHGLDDFDAFPHYGGRANLFSFFALANFLHEDFRRAEAEHKTLFACRFLQDARLHGNLDGM